jgi:hypothetical protein
VGSIVRATTRQHLLHCQPGRVPRIATRTCPWLPSISPDRVPLKAPAGPLSAIPAPRGIAGLFRAARHLGCAASRTGSAPPACQLPPVALMAMSRCAVSARTRPASVPAHVSEPGRRDRSRRSRCLKGDRVKKPFGIQEADHYLANRLSHPHRVHRARCAAGWIDRELDQAARCAR